MASRQEEKEQRRQDRILAENVHQNVVKHQINQAMARANASADLIRARERLRILAIVDEMLAEPDEIDGRRSVLLEARERIVGPDPDTEPGLPGEDL